MPLAASSLNLSSNVFPEAVPCGASVKFVEPKFILSTRVEVPAVFVLNDILPVYDPDASLKYASIPTELTAVPAAFSIVKSILPPIPAAAVPVVTLEIVRRSGIVAVPESEYVRPCVPETCNL